MANYLYNGVELPALPEWDKETYPYAVIVKSSTATIAGTYLCVSNGEVPTHNGNTTVQFRGDGITWKLSNDAWGSQTEKSTYFEIGGVVGASSIIWANVDIVNTKSGAVWRYASEPVPVGGEPIDPTSFMQGYIVGRRLAGMRK